MQLEVVLGQDTAVPMMRLKPRQLFISSTKRSDVHDDFVTESAFLPAHLSLDSFHGESANKIEHSQERVCSASESRVRSHFFVESHGGFVPSPAPACSITFLDQIPFEAEIWIRARELTLDPVQAVPDKRPLQQPLHRFGAVPMALPETLISADQLDQIQSPLMCRLVT